MSTRISQGSSFQATTLKGPGGPDAAQAGPAPTPTPKPTPPPPQPADAFVRDVVRDFQRLLGLAQPTAVPVPTPAPAPAAQQASAPPSDHEATGRDKEDNGMLTIHDPNASGVTVG